MFSIVACVCSGVSLCFAIYVFLVQARKLRAVQTELNEERVESIDMMQRALEWKQRLDVYETAFDEVAKRRRQTSDRPN